MARAIAGDREVRRVLENVPTGDWATIDRAPQLGFAGKGRA